MAHEKTEKNKRKSRTSFTTTLASEIKLIIFMVLLIQKVAHAFLKVNRSYPEKPVFTAASEMDGMQEIFPISVQEIV
jgi:hypothetical protein